MVLFATLLTACGYGLDPLVYEPEEMPLEPPVEVEIEGATFAVPLTEVDGISPAGLQVVFEELDAGAALVHVVRDDFDVLELAMALSAEDGRQSLCEPIHFLPVADFSRNPWLEVHGAALPLSIGGEPVTLEYLGMSVRFTGDGERWDAGTMSAVIDTRELEGVFKEGTDVCAVVESMEGTCEPCADGVEACVDVELDNVKARRVPITFDPDLDTSGC